MAFFKKTLSGLLLVAGLLVGFLSGVAFVVWRGLPELGLPAAGEASVGAPAPPAPDPAKVAEVLAGLSATVKARPDDPGPLLEMGGFLIDLARYQEAAECYQKALDLGGPQPGPLVDLGLCLRELGRPEEALRLFDQAISLDGQQKSAFYNAGVVALHDLGDGSRALGYFEAYLTLDPPRESREMISRVVAQLKAEQAAAKP